MTGDPEPLDQADRGEQLRLVEKNLSEHLFVKQVQAPGPEPDEIDEKDGEDDDEQRQNRTGPFQDTSKHAESVVRPPPPRSMLYRAEFCSRRPAGDVRAAFASSDASHSEAATAEGL